MIIFYADNHYLTYSGRRIYENLCSQYNILFYEDDWRALSQEIPESCELLILSMIGDTCGIAHPGAAAEISVRNYIQAGRPVLLLHGGSAAFWQWDWWRKLVGYRWVRSDDPDGVEASTHPTRSYTVNISKSRHPLISRLRSMELPADEIYIEMEQTAPAMVLMETHLEEGTFPQCYEVITPFGGHMIGFLPGHSPSVTQHQDVLLNIKALIDYLLTTTDPHRAGSGVVSEDGATCGHKT